MPVHAIRTRIGIQRHAMMKAPPTARIVAEMATSPKETRLAHPTRSPRHRSTALHLMSTYEGSVRIPQASDKDNIKRLERQLIGLHKISAHQLEDGECSQQSR